MHIYTYIQVKRHYQRSIARFVQRNFQSWRDEARSSRRLRMLTIDSWRSYSRLMVVKPFHAWAGRRRALYNHFLHPLLYRIHFYLFCVCVFGIGFVSGAKNKAFEHARLAASYMRCKTRKFLRLIVKTWRHQVSFRLPAFALSPSLSLFA
jgi:hypothetical protein